MTLTNFLRLVFVAALFGFLGWRLAIMWFRTNRQDNVMSKAAENPKGILLEKLSWLKAKEILQPDTVVTFALGAAAKEHGPHLQLNNDFIIAEYLKNRVLAASNVAMAPTVNYHYYPAFTKYAGSTHLSLQTATNLIVEICESYTPFGPKRFYVINTGVSTREPLLAAKKILAKKGILLDYTVTRKLVEDVESAIREQKGGTHADEMETSMMLYMAPETVDMSLAADDFDPNGGLGLSPVRDGKSTYSPTGIWGNATLATREKGEKIVEALVAGILQDIENVRTAPLPVAENK